MNKLTKFDKANNILLGQAKDKLQKYKDKLAQQITIALRKKYKGKRVKCECFDSWTDGDEYYFDEDLLDIKAHADMEDGFYINATFNYKSPFSPEEEKTKPCTFYLYTIESVK